MLKNKKRCIIIKKNAPAIADKFHSSDFRRIADFVDWAEVLSVVFLARGTEANLSIPFYGYRRIRAERKDTHIIHVAFRSVT